MNKFVVSDSKILGGKPVIAGTRIPLTLILNLLKDGYTIEAIHDLYPQLSIKTIDGAIEEFISHAEQKCYAA